uniref:Uncharacterized protein n=1 Tax=viral metagenome TaxID=1070528 RepID=A0A6H1ZAD8_9ZZZZ
MSTIRQHIPSFFEGLESKISTFNSFEELKEISWIKNWTTDPKFIEFKILESKLIAIFKNDERWVVGFINE